MRRACPHTLALVASGLLSFVGTNAAHADDLSDLQGLLSEQVVTSASKQPEGASSAPALATNLSAEDLRRYGIATLAEAIDFLSLGVASSDNLNGGEIGARGVLLTGDRGSHFLLLVDGHAVNEPLRGSAGFGAGAGIPLELVDHIEVIVGPGSVLYGSNAMLGLINVVTKRAKDFSGIRVFVESSLLTRVRTGAGFGRKFTLFGQESEVTGEVEYVKQTGPSFLFNAENTGIDQFTMQPGRNSRAEVGTGIWGGAHAENGLYAEAPAGIVRLAVGNTQLELNGSYYRHAAPTGKGDFDDPETGDRDTRVSVDLKHRLAVSTFLDVSARAYADYYQLRSELVASRGSLCPFGIITCHYQSDGTALWGGLDLQTTWDWLKNGRFMTVVGADGRARKLDTTSNVVNIDTGKSVYPAIPGLNVTDATFGGYVQQTWLVTDAVRLSGGARLDWDHRFPIVLTPRLAASWNAWSGGTVKIAYAEAFRAPSWDETSNSTSDRIVANSLASEKVRSVELSAQHRFGAHRLIVGGFYSRWSNLVELETLSNQETIDAIRDGKTSVPYTPGVQLTQYRNVADIKNYGMNTAVEGSFAYDRVRYAVNITGAFAQRQAGEVTQPLTVAPQIFGNARVAVALGEKLPTVALAARFMGKRAADRAFDGNFTPTPYAPPQLEMRLIISGDVPVLKGISYRAMASYAVADRGPYVVGPVTSALPTQASAQLIPVDTFRTTVGLMYTF